MSDSPGLLDFAIGLVDSDHHLPDGQVKFFWELKLKITVGHTFFNFQVDLWFSSRSHKGKSVQQSIALHA